MKKIILFAAVVLAVGMTSCKEGKCACVGVDDNGRQISEERKTSGESSSSVCKSIMNNYKVSTTEQYQCFEDKSLSDLTAK